MATFDIKLKITPELDLTTISKKLSDLKASMDKLGKDISVVNADDINEELIRIEKAMNTTFVNTQKISNAFDNMMPKANEDPYFEDLQNQIQLTRAEIERLRFERDKISKSGGSGFEEYKEIKKTISEATLKLQEMKKAKKEMEATGDKSSNEYKKLKEDIAAATASLSKFKYEKAQALQDGKAGANEFDSVEKSIKNATKQLEILNKEYDDYSKKNNKTTPDIDSKSAVAGINSITSSANMMTKAFNFNQITQMVDTLGSSLVGLTQPFTQLDTASQKIKTLGGAAADLAPTLRAASLKMSSEVGLASSEILDASYEALSAGIKANEKDMNDFMSASSKLAVGGAETVGNSVNLLSSMINAYGLEASKTTQVSDILFNTVNLGKTNIKELSSSLSGVIPTASAMGVQLDNVGASLALMTAKGVPTAQATTKLNALLVEFAKPTKGVQDALKAAGVSMGDFQAKLKNNDMAGALKDLQAGFVKTGKSATESFGSVEASAAFNLLGADIKSYEETLAGVGGTAGSTEAAFKLMSDSIAVKTEAMKNKFDNFMINVLDSSGPIGVFGSTFAGVLGEIAPQINALAGISTLVPEGAFKKANDLIVKLIPSLAGIGATSTTAFGAVATSSTVAGTAASTAGTATGTAWSMALSPLMAVIAAAVLVGSIFYYLYTRVESFRNAIDGFVELLKQGFEKGLEAGQKLLSVFIAIGESIFNFIVVPFQTAWKVIVAILKPFADLTNSSKLTTQAIQFLGKAFDFLLSVLNYVQAGFKGFTASLQTVADSLSGVIVKVLKGDIIGAVEELMKGGKKAGDAFNKSFTDQLKTGKMKKEIAEQTKEAGKTPITPPQLPPTDNQGNTPTTKAKKTELEIANSLYDKYQKTSKIKQEDVEIEYEKVRIAQKREKTSLDELGTQQRKLTSLNEELAQYKEIFKVKEDADGKVEVGLNVKDEEKASIINKYHEIINSINKDSNSLEQIKAKVSIDTKEIQNSLKKLEIDKLKYEIEVGIKPSYAILPILESDFQVIKDKIKEIETEQDKFKIDGTVVVPDDQKAYYDNLTKQLVDYRSKLITSLKEIRSEKQKIYKDELSDLQEKHDKELAILSKKLEREKELTKLISDVSVEVGVKFVDEQKSNDLAQLETLKEKELITEELYNKKKEDLEQEHKNKLNAIRDAANGYTMESERRLSLELLEKQKSTLGIERQKASENGDIEKTKQLDKQLADITASIKEKGDVLTSYSGELQDTLTATFSNLFQGDEESIKAPFKKLFATIAGALKQYLSLLATEMVFGELKKYAGSMGITALFLIPAFQGVINAALDAILNPILANVASFSTGGRVDEPTVAIVGDASKSKPGTDTEWILRDDHLWLIVEESVKKTVSETNKEIKNTLTDIMSDVQEKFIKNTQVENTVKEIKNMFEENHNTFLSKNELQEEIIKKISTNLDASSTQTENEIRKYFELNSYDKKEQNSLVKTDQTTLNDITNIVRKTNEAIYNFKNTQEEIIKSFNSIPDAQIQFIPIEYKLNELVKTIQTIQPMFKENEMTYENIKKLSEEYITLVKSDAEFRENKISEDVYLDRINQTSLKIKSYAGGSGFLTQPQLAVVGDAGVNNPEIVLNNPQLQAIINQASGQSNKEVVKAIKNLENTFFSALNNLQLRAVVADVKQATDEINRENNRRKR